MILKIHYLTIHHHPQKSHLITCWCLMGRYIKIKGSFNFKAQIFIGIYLKSENVKCKSLQSVNNSVSFDD